MIGRGGVAALSQRAVAQEAALPPSAVTYYFATADALLVAALSSCNDRYLRRLDECARAEDPLGELAAVIAEGAADGGARTAAEYELFLLAGRHPELQHEAVRWAEAVDAFLAPFAPDPVDRAGAAAAVDGLFLRCHSYPGPPDAAAVRAVLDRLLRRGPAPAVPAPPEG
ncbi:TetR family transcriptional regulator [Allonocardiopsis opalescens]|uniref:TetR family transcriptional regulator n=1 Tax=Allonocardiopsis opalescens TaxID=1144618 RepID=A0A2T0PYV4_9ACTN|nr:TetR family transcriptional regulator [Allonocardiopsis opalescens]